jgi:hypothetical protein
VLAVVLWGENLGAAFELAVTIDVLALVNLVAAARLTAAPLTRRQREGDRSRSRIGGTRSPAIGHGRAERSRT